MDMIATASAQDYERALGLLIADPDVDAVIAIFIPPLSTRPAEVGAAIRRAVEARERDVPVLGVFMTPRAPRSLRTRRVQVPSYAYPEDAARALAAVAGHARWLRRAPGTVPELEDARPEEAAAVIARALQDGGDGEWMTPADAAALLACYGIPLVPARLAATAAEAGRVAGELGGPVALKGVARGLVHKTEAHAVRLDLDGAPAVEAAAEAMAASLARDGHELDGFLVQRMAATGTELLVGVVHDPTFGPLVACGAGGVTAELLGDVSVRLTPLTDVDAREMVRALRTFPLLDGFRGAPPADVGALEDVLVRVAALADAHPELAELDLNPLVVGPGGAVAVDARMRLTAARGPARQGGRRR